MIETTEAQPIKPFSEWSTPNLVGALTGVTVLAATVASPFGIAEGIGVNGVRQDLSLSSSNPVVEQRLQTLQGMEIAVSIFGAAVTLGVFIKALHLLTFGEDETGNPVNGIRIVRGASAELGRRAIRNISGMARRVAGQISNSTSSL